MNELLDKILRLKLVAKVGLTLGVMAAVGGIYNFMFLADLQDEISAAQTQKTQLTTERASYEKRKTEYLAYRNELTKLMEEQREILKVLPNKAELPTFLNSLQEQAELSGIEVQSTVPQAEVPEDLYVRIPVKLEVVGSYHGVTKFFRNISELPRIVNLENVSLLPEKPGAGEPDSSGRMRLRAKFVTVAYRFQDQPAAAPGAAPAPGATP